VTNRDENARTGKHTFRPGFQITKPDTVDAFVRSAEDLFNTGVPDKLKLLILEGFVLHDL
jgi:hypothetical protein